MAEMEPDGCPSCGRWQEIHVERCASCPVAALEEAMSGPWGKLLHRCFSIRRELKMGFHLGLSDITAIERQILDIIEDEMPQPVLPIGR